MKTVVFSLLILACGLTVLTRNLPSSKTVKLGPPEAIQTSGGKPDRAGPYVTAGVLTWELDEPNLRVEARMETLMSAAARGSPAARLKIINLADDKIIFERDSEDDFISMYTRELNEDIGKVLVINWGGGAANRIEILKVGATQTRTLLSESYRIDAAFVDLSGEGKTDLLLTTGGSGAGPFYTTRYIWKDNSFQIAGRVSYKKFINVVRHQFR